MPGALTRQAMVDIRTREQPKVEQSQFGRRVRVIDKRHAAGIDCVTDLSKVVELPKAEGFCGHAGRLCHFESDCSAKVLARQQAEAIRGELSRHRTGLV